MGVSGPIRRGDVYFADLNPTRGSEQAGDRPVVVVQNDVGNKYSPVTVVAVMTASFNEKELRYPQCVFVDKKYTGLQDHSVVFADHIRNVDWRQRFRRYVCTLPDEIMREIGEAMALNLGLTTCPSCGTPVRSSDQVCPNRVCVRQLRVRCLCCGEYISTQWRYCPQCGLQRGCKP